MSQIVTLSEHTVLRGWHDVERLYSGRIQTHILSQVVNIQGIFPNI